jgi:hypothetical protein
MTSGKMQDTETTITIDITRLPEHCRRGNTNPFFYLDNNQLDCIGQWIESKVPEELPSFKAELIGKVPGAVGLYIGALLKEMGCVELKHVHPGNGVLKIFGDE